MEQYTTTLFTPKTQFSKKTPKIKNVIKHAATKKEHKSL